MEKIVTIEGQEIKLKTHGNTPNMYEAQFGADLFNEMNKMSKEGIKMSVFSNFLWLSAKIANPDILPPDEWNASFESMPIASCFEEVQEMLMKLMPEGKMKPPKAAKKNR